uniref:Integrase catalytic domain-containing protein n=1 Tax=Bracon brevicornis TaxID=1563983 RepID=A0A6V7M070_9HYME
MEPAHIDVPDSRFDHVHLDIIELPVVNGLRYCLTMIDRFSRWPVAVPLKNIEAETIASAFSSDWIAFFGSPLKITTDQGSLFESRLFTALANLVGTQKIHTTSYRPQSNGIIERWHRTLKAALMCNAPTPWPELPPTVLLGLRCAFKEDLRASPAQLLFGTDLRLPGEFFSSEEMPAEPNFFLQKFREHMRKLRPTPTAHHNKARSFVLKDLYKCSHVFLRQDAVKKPLEPPYSGPHEIVTRVDDRVSIIKVNGVDKAISIDRLKPAYIAKSDTPTTQEQQPPAAQLNQPAQPTPPPAAEQNPSVQLTPPPARSEQPTPLPPQSVQPAPSPVKLSYVPEEYRSTSIDPPIMTYSRAPKKVSFPSLPEQVSGGGVDVREPRPTGPVITDRAHHQRRRRKQVLVPRQDL